MNLISKAQIKRKSSDFKKELSNKIATNLSISIFCGAGISMDYGLPSWNSFIKRLYVEAFKALKSPSIPNFEPQEIAKLYASLNDSNSPLINASQVKNILRDDFLEIIRDCLYASSSYPSKKTALIESMSKAIIQKYNNGLNEIVTYNFDDILEDTLRTNLLKVKSIVNGRELSNITGKENVLIYYVHGRVPHRSGDSTSDSIVFAESEYYNLQNYMSSWQNRVQLDLLSKSTVIMLGLSLMDPNLRRLLEMSYKETKRKHFLIKKILSLKDLEKDFKRKSIPVPPMESLTLIRQTTLSLDQWVADSMGVQLIYVEQYNDISILFDEIFDLE